MPRVVTSAARAVLPCLLVVAIVALPPQVPAKTGHRQSFANRSCLGTHEPTYNRGVKPKDRHPRHRQRQKRIAPLSAFFAVPPGPKSTCGGSYKSSTRSSILERSSFAERRGCANDRPSRSQSTALAASKNKRKATKRKKGGAAAGGGGFGGAPIASTETKTVDQKEAGDPRPSQRSAPPARGGQLPDDDFATFPPLSPDTLKSVMGVDVFDLPPGGIPASQRGQQQAFPAQVLECIRGRHGLEEFAGGRQLLDPEYMHHESSEAAASPTASEAAASSPEGSQEKVVMETEEGGRRDGSSLLFPGLRLLHAEPPVVGVDDFFTAEECEEYVSRLVSPPPPSVSAAAASTQAAAAPGAAGAGPHMQRSATLGADVDAVAQRTSTTWFHRFSAVPELMAKASALVGVPFEEGRWEEAQTVRYRPGEKFTWHLDALPPSPELAGKGGQRIATLLVYLTEMPEGDGGATAFRDLGPLRVRPRKGTALLFFPSCGGAPDCPFDIRTLHAGEVVRPGAEQDKWIAQLWLREGRYTPTVPVENRHADAESVVAEFDKAWRES